MRTKAVLIVEDSPDTRYIFTAILQRAGYTVFQAEDGGRGYAPRRSTCPT